MRIERGETHHLSLPLNREYRIAGTETSTMETVLVVLETENGERGIGTADPVPGHPIPNTAKEIYDALTERLLPDLIAESPDSMNQLYQLLGEYDGMENAMCAAEMAYLDLFGRCRGEPLAKVLGGRLRDEVRLNAWVGIGTAETMAEKAEDWRSQSFDSLKMKASGDPSTDIRRITAVCEAVGDDMQIRVDANEGYASPEEALRVIDAVDHLPIEHFEQPVSRTDLGDLQEITERSPITILADESVITKFDAADILGQGIADKLKFKILQSGGIMNVKQALDVADVMGGRCVLGHGFCTAPGASAELQFAASHDNVFDPIETVGELKIEESPFDSPWTIENGRVRIPDEPGLGVELRQTDLDTFVLESAQSASKPKS